MGKVGGMCQQGKREKSSKTAQNNKRAHAKMWASSHSSMSPSMSSTGCEQLGWELLCGAAERVTRSVSGTKASHCANNGNACCIARSLICRQLLFPATFTPSTSRQFSNTPFVQSRSLPFCAAITNFACILATPRPLSGLRGVANSSALLFSPSSQTSSTTRTCAKACVAH